MPEGTDVLSVSPLCTLHELHSAALTLHASTCRLLAGHPPRELDTVLYGFKGSNRV